MVEITTKTFLQLTGCITNVSQGNMSHGKGCSQKKYFLKVKTMAEQGGGGLDWMNFQIFQNICQKFSLSLSGEGGGGRGILYEKKTLMG